jgi:hypothetical protein
MAIGRLSALIPSLGRWTAAKEPSVRTPAMSREATEPRVPTVRLRESQPPVHAEPVHDENEGERYLYAALADGPMPLAALIDQVAEQLQRDENARGGWISDIGIWGPATYRSQVADLIRSLDGSTLIVEPSVGPNRGWLTWL